MAFSNRTPSGYRSRDWMATVRWAIIVSTALPTHNTRRGNFSKTSRENGSLAKENLIPEVRPSARCFLLWRPGDER